MESCAVLLLLLVATGSCQMPVAEECPTFPTLQQEQLQPLDLSAVSLSLDTQLVASE